MNEAIPTTPNSPGSDDSMRSTTDTDTTSVSNASTPEEIGEYWDTHSLADHWDATREVEVEVRAQRRRRVTLEPALYEQVEKHARTRGMQAEALVNIWIAEQLAQQRP